MKKELKIDKAIYLVDNKTKSYIFLKRNLNWRSLGKEENKRNKRHISGYERIFRNGNIKLFRHRLEAIKD